MEKFFGTDGIRGTVGKPPITADFLLKVGWAVGSVLTENGPASVIIGRTLVFQVIYLSPPLRRVFCLRGLMWEC